MKTVVIGGSAQSTPALFDTDFLFDGKEFSFDFVGRSKAKVSSVVRAARLIAAERGYQAECRPAAAESLESALRGADVVLIQFRVGGYAARSWDETFPHRYGAVGDEGLGLGGLAAAWRTWPELKNTLASVKQTCPQAFVVLLTSPIGILTRCAREAFADLRIYGICELPWTTLQEVCRPVGVDARFADFAYIAVNHLGWFSDIRVGDMSLVGSTETRSLKYVRLDEAPQEVLREQQAAPARGRALEILASDAFAIYGSGNVADILAATRRRPTPWYAHAVAPLLYALAGNEVETTFFLTAQNDGYCETFADDDFIEMPYILAKSQLQRRIRRPWKREDIASKLLRLIEYERAAADAVRSRDKSRLQATLRLHPWVDGISISAELTSDVCRDSPAAAATSLK